MDMHPAPVGHQWQQAHIVDWVAVDFYTVTTYHQNYIYNNSQRQLQLTIHCNLS